MVYKKKMAEHLKNRDLSSGLSLVPQPVRKNGDLTNTRYCASPNID